MHHNIIIKDSKHFKNCLQWDKKTQMLIYFLSVSHDDTFLCKAVYCDLLTFQHELPGLAVPASWYL